MELNEKLIVNIILAILAGALVGSLLLSYDLGRVKESYTKDLEKALKDCQYSKLTELSKDREVIWEKENNRLDRKFMLLRIKLLEKQIQDHEHKTQ